MLLDQKVDTFWKAGIGVITATISLAFIFLIGFFIFKASRFSIGGIGFLILFAFLAYWFGNISYKLITSESKKRPYLFSPNSIICIFAFVGLGIIAGTIYRFSNGQFENGFLGLLLLLLFFPTSHYCWKSAKQQAATQGGT